MTLSGYLVNFSMTNVVHGFHNLWMRAVTPWVSEGVNTLVQRLCKCAGYWTPLL